MTKNWLKYCFYSSSLCCNNIINGMDARNRINKNEDKVKNWNMVKNVYNISNKITSKDIEKVKNYNVNPKKICNERELKQDIYEKNMTDKEYYEKKKGQIENNYASFWKNNNLVSDDKYTNRKHNLREGIVEMSDNIKEEDKYNEQSSEMKEEDGYNKKASEVKEVIDKNSIKYIEKNILQINSISRGILFPQNNNLKNDNIKLKKNVEEICLDDFNKKINDLLNEKTYILKDNNSYNIDSCLNFDKYLTSKTQINLDNITGFKHNSNSYGDIRYIESK